jgi:hypothetical protein
LTGSFDYRGTIGFFRKLGTKPTATSSGLTTLIIRHVPKYRVGGPGGQVGHKSGYNGLYVWRTTDIELKDTGIYRYGSNSAFRLLNVQVFLWHF